MVEEQEEELTNGLDHDPEETYKTASVTVNLVVAEILGRAVENEEEQQLFLALISSFFSSDLIFEQLKMFVQFNMNEQPAIPESKLVVPEKKLILPGR